MFLTNCFVNQPNQFEHHAETVNSVHSRQHGNDCSASKPTAIIRPRLHSRLRYGLKPEFNSRELIFCDSQRKELTIHETALSTQFSRVPHEAVTALPHLRLQDLWNCCLSQTRPSPSFFSLETPNQILFPFIGVSYRLTTNAQTLEKALLKIKNLTRSLTNLERFRLEMNSPKFIKC